MCTSLLTDAGLSDLIDVMCGVKQGCALSSILFLLAIDPIVKRVQRNRDATYTLVYADDMGVIEDKIEEINKTINAIVETANELGLQINPKKCYSLHINNNHQNTSPTVFKINDIPINTLNDLEIEKYLGKPFGFYII